MFIPVLFLRILFEGMHGFDEQLNHCLQIRPNCLPTVSFAAEKKSLSTLLLPMLLLANYDYANDRTGSSSNSLMVND